MEKLGEFALPNFLPIVREGVALGRPLLDEAAAVASKLGREAFAPLVGGESRAMAKGAGEVLGSTARQGGPVDVGHGAVRGFQGGPVEFRDRSLSGHTAVKTLGLTDEAEKVVAPIKTTQGLPLWTNEGFLPPGVYKTGVEEFNARFAFNEHRREQLLRAQPVFDRLRSQGFDSVYAAGSFVSNKARPTDIDLLLHTGKLSPSAANVLYDLRGIPHGQTAMNAKRLYGVDLWQGKSVNGANCEHFKFFSTNRQDVPVGMVELMLKGR